MNEKNLESLCNQLVFTGFGDILQKDLREKMLAQTSGFTLLHRAIFGKEEVEAVLLFMKSGRSDQYFFKSYFLELINEQVEEAFTQSFKIGREANITLKEAFNLMKGRAIHKEMKTPEGQKYQVWLQFDFKEMDEAREYKMKQFHQNYGFDLRETLAKYRIKELDNVESAHALVRSLERGNRQQVTLRNEEKEQKLFIEANPQFKSLNFYYSWGQRFAFQPQSQWEKQVREENEKEGENWIDNPLEKPDLAVREIEKQSVPHSEKGS